MDVITNITKKRAALIQRKRDITASYNAQIREIDTEISAINNAISVINDAMKDYLCPNCRGYGTVRICDAAGDMDDNTCPICKGTGVKI